jgi:hypothetical protein
MGEALIIEVVTIITKESGVIFLVPVSMQTIFLRIIKRLGLMPIVT